MNSRVKAMGIILAIFICLQIWYFETIIVLSLELRVTCAEFVTLKNDIMTSTNTT